MATNTQHEFDLEAATKAIAAELGLPLGQVLAAVELLNAGNTIPFIARYRKEATGGLDEVALRAIEDALEKATALAARKATVLKTIDEQGQLTDELRLANRELHATYARWRQSTCLSNPSDERARPSLASEDSSRLPICCVRQDNTRATRNKRRCRAFVNPDTGGSRLRHGLARCARYHRRAMVRRSGDAKLDDRRQAFASGKITSQVKRGKKEEASKYELYIDHQEPCPQNPLSSLVGDAAWRSGRCLASWCGNWMIRRLCRTSTRN